MFFENFDKNTAKRLYDKSNRFAKEYAKNYKDTSIDTKQGAFPIAGMYTALQEQMDAQDAKKMMLDYVPVVGEKLRKYMLAVTGIPGITIFLWKNIEKIMSIAGSEKKGYKSRIYGVNGNKASMDILVCPIHNMLVKLGVPEISVVMCKLDLIYSTGYAGIEFKRTKSVAAGDDCCDYRYKKL